MNIVTNLITRIEDYRATNKQPCKNYATQEAAEKALAKAAALAGKIFDRDGRPANYVVFFVPGWDRWTGAMDYNELFRRKSSVGGYIGAIPGFFTY